MPTINFGNIIGNRVVGISSGIDSSAIITELSKIRQKPIDDVNSKITSNTTKISEYGNLSSSLTNLKTSLNYLRNPPGILNRYSNAFNYRTATLSSATVTSSDYLSVTANPGAQLGKSVIQIGNLAKALEQRSASFNARDISATTSATGAYFGTGTFQIGSGIVEGVTGDTLSGFNLIASNYSVAGSATGILTSQGIHNFVVTGGTGGQIGLEGTVGSSISAALSAGDITLTTSINGVTYTSNAITADDSINAGANTGITSGTTITFTANAGGAYETSFDIELDQDVIIDNSQSNADDFANDLEDALEDQTVLQSRRIQNFVNGNVKSPLTGLANSNIRFVSDSFNKTTGEFGKIGGFTVQYSSGSDGAISVDINGETFRATGLGTTLNSNLTLQSTTTDKQLLINLGDAGASASISSKANATALERALDYAFGTRELVDITVASGDSLNDVIFAINQQTINTGVTASVIQVSSFDYRFSLKANNEGIDNKYEIFDSSNVLTNTSILSDTSNLAEDALLSIDGVEVERSSNSISDVIENVTLELTKVTEDYGLVTADEITLSINKDIDTVTDRIVAFLDAYNAFRVYDAGQNQRDPNTLDYLEEAILGGDSVLKTLAFQLENQIIGVVGNASDDEYDALSDIGIGLQDFEGDSSTIATKNILQYDEATLKERLAANFDKVRQIFEFQFTSSSSSLGIFKTSNSYTINDFKLDIDTSRDEGEQVQLMNSDGSAYLDDGDPVYLDIDGSLITGQAGTAVDGLQFIYSGDGSDVISISLVQGIADRIYNITDEYTASDGVLDDAVETLSEENTKFDSDILTLQERLDDFVAQLRVQFSKLEQAVNAANSVLLLLDSQEKARNSNN